MQQRTRPHDRTTGSLGTRTSRRTAPRRPSALAPGLALAAAAIALALPSTTTAQVGSPASADTAANAPGTAIERALESRTLGDTDASVVIFEIADFQCPYCARFAESVGPDLHERYVATGEVQWIFVNLPLHNHPLAWHAAEAALCAGAADDQFWPMHDKLFAEQAAWSATSDPRPHFDDYAAQLGIPAAEFSACLDQDQVAQLILQDFGSAVSAGITGTPAFIIMKDQQVVDRLVGLQPMEEWTRVIEVALGR